MAILQPLESVTEVQVQVKVRGVLCIVYAGKFAYDVCMHLVLERRRGLDLIICRSMERKSFGYHIDKLVFKLIRVCTEKL